MRPTDENLFWQENVEDIKARILVAQFNGALDTGGTTRLAVEEMLHSPPTERVTTFDTDAFLNHRSHRPFATASDWMLEFAEMPKLVLDRVKSDLGNPVLVLHGAEPDTKWKSFSRVVTELATRAGAEIVVSFNGMPSGIPHTRSVPAHVQATERALIPGQPQMATTSRFPTSMVTFLWERLTNQGTLGIVFLAATPFCVADATYPAGAPVPSGALSGLADLSLPVGELERDVAEEHAATGRILESNSEIQRTVVAPEEYFDALSRVGKDGVPPGEWAKRTPLGFERKTEEDISDVIEVYLANLAEQPEKDGAEEA